MNTVQYPDEVPEAGHRVLSGREAAQRSRAMACIRQRNASVCQGQVYVSLFFDGTGNNRDWKEPGQALTQLQRNGHSNVARLFDAHPDEPKSGFFRVYIPGIGTPFKEIGDVAGWLNPWGVFTDKGGNGAGLRGADRINWGILQILNAVHVYLVGADLIQGSAMGTIANNMSSLIANLGFEGPMRRTILGTWEEKLESVIKAHQRRLTQINIALFGFSRGAATARACANWLAQICESSGGGFKLAGVPVRTYFTGLFDSVASSGIVDAVPGFDGHMAWADGNMAIHPMVEECVHFVALHEQRASFPLQNADNARQVGYPGMHSDVGGGYAPSEQGKGMSPLDGGTGMLSQVSLVDMHHAALKAGVPLMTMSQILARPILKAAFTVPSELRDVFNAFLRAHGVPRGQPLDKATRRHTEHYLRWRGLRESNLQTQPFFDRAPPADREDLVDANRQLRVRAAELRARRKANSTVSGRSFEQMKDVARALQPPAWLLMEDGKEPLTKVESQLLEAFETPQKLPVALARLFDDYVHDSRAGFRILGRHEPESLTGGYFRYRRVFDHS